MDRPMLKEAGKVVGKRGKRQRKERKRTEGRENHQEVKAAILVQVMED